MFEKRRAYWCPQGIKYEIKPFPSGEFGDRHKITITRNQNNLIGQFFRDIEAMSIPIFISTPFWRMNKSKTCFGNIRNKFCSMICPVGF